MKRLHTRPSSESGFVLDVHGGGSDNAAAVSGLAVDTGRAYVVKAQLTKAVDGAALAAARNLNSGNPRDEAARVFNANFPTGTSARPRSPIPRPIRLFQLGCGAANGVNIVTVRAHSDAADDVHEARQHRHRWRRRRRRGDEAHGRSVARCSTCRARSDGDGGAVRDAARTFVGSFDAVNDRDVARSSSATARRVRGRHALGARLQQDPGHRPTFQTRCRAAARTWSKASIEDGTR